MTAAISVTRAVAEARTASLGSGGFGHGLPTVDWTVNGAGDIHDVSRVCGTGLFEVAIRAAECLHHARRCGDGMRAFECAWQIVCSAGITDPKFVASCLLRLGSAHLTCGCRPTAIAKLGRTQGHDEHAPDDRHTLDHVLAELVALITAAPTTGSTPGRAANRKRRRTGHLKSSDPIVGRSPEVVLAPEPGCRDGHDARC